MILPAAELLLLALALAVLMVVCLIRALLGPTVPDRVVALDTLNTQVVAALVVLATAWGEIIYIDVAIVYAILAFVSTLYVAKYMEENA